MSTDLEKDITAIKVSVARVEEKLKQFDNHLTIFVRYEERLRSLEDFKAKANGYAAALGAIAGLIVVILTKLF